MLTSGSAYAREARRLLDLTNGLRALGVEQVLRVPTLVIAGNQSSGG